MRMMIEARLLDDTWDGASIPLGVIDRQGGRNDPLGLSLADGRALLARVQEILVRAQCDAIASANERCARCARKMAV